jgi:hypothetical protein
MFKKLYPNMPIDDYRPLCKDFVSGKVGITIWLSNGDMVQYFPNTDKKDDKE